MYKIVDAAKASAESACDAELSSPDSPVLDRLKGVALRVASSQLVQWKAMAADVGVTMSPDNVGLARQKFIAAADTQARVAYKVSV